MSGFSAFDEHAEHKDHIARSSADTSVGIVSAAKNDPVLGPVVRVTYPDCDGKVSAWLPVMQKSTVGTSTYHLPRLRERVLVQKLSNGRENGVVVGSIYSSSVSNPVQSDSTNVGSTFDDGSTLHVNPIQGNAAVSMTQSIDVIAGGNVHIVSSGNTAILSNTTITINGSGIVTINSGAQVNVTAPLINANGVTIDPSGNVIIPGTLTVKGYVTNESGGQTAPHMSNVDGLSTDQC